MRNIWAIVVAIVLVGGVGVSISKLIGGDEPRRPAHSTPQPAEPVSTAEAGDGVPTSDKTFAEVPVREDDYVMGSADAPVTIVEYASLTCPHCARFHSGTLPGLKKEFIDTGKVRLVFRDYPLDRLAFTASVVARCAGRDRYLGFVDTFFASQQSWARDSNPVAAIGRIARLGGMSPEAFDACLKNQEIGDAVLKSRMEGQKTFEVNATPTLIINGRKFSGGLTLEQIRAIIQPMLNKS